MSDFGFGFGGPGGLDPFGIDAWLTGAIAAILSALSYIWSALVAAANWLLNAVIALAKFIASHILIAARALAHIAERLYTDILKPIIKELRAIEVFLRDRFYALEDILSHIYAWYAKYILKYQLIALQVLSSLRAAIELFKVLGFKWAQKLDAELAKIQGYISESILPVVQTLNTITNWLNFATDPLGLIRKQFWQTSAYTNLVDIVKAGNIGATRPLSDTDKQDSIHNQQLMDPKTPPVTIGAGGAPVYSAAMQDIVDGFAKALPYYDPTTPGYVGPEAG